MHKKFNAALAGYLESNHPVAVATIVEASGSSPGRVGSKILVDRSGRLLGTIGGGCLEAAVIEEAVHSLETGQPRLARYNLTESDAAGLGMACGGNVTVFIEPMLADPLLVIAGGGHISQELCRMARQLGYAVLVIDDRQEFANEELFPDADRLIVGAIPAALRELEIDRQTYIVIVTRGHRFDEEALHAVSGTEAAYIGMIGSKRKVKAVFDNLLQKGVSSQQLAKVYAPIGLQLGGNSPAEIALSIIAQIQQVRYYGKGERI